MSWKPHRKAVVLDAINDFSYEQQIREYIKGETVLEFILRYMWLGLICNY